MILVLLTVALVLPPRLSGAFSSAVAAGVLLHHQIQRSRPERWRSHADEAPRQSPQSIGRTGEKRGSILVYAAALSVGGILAIGMSWQPGQPFAFESTKMVASGLVLLAASHVVRTDGEVQRMQLWVSLALMIVVVLGRFVTPISITISGTVLAPPVGNSAAVLVCFLAPVALGLLRPRNQLLYLALMAFFGYAIFSRFVIGAVVILMARSFGRDRILRFSSVAALALVVFGPQFRGFRFGNFSDQLRLRIWGFSIDRITDNHGLLIANGEQEFIDQLSAEPFYRSLEVSHAHNLILHVWNSYGLVVTAVWVGAVILVMRALWGIDSSLNVQLIALAALAQLEAIITDARVLLTVMFFLGIRWRSLQEDNAAESSEQDQLAVDPSRRGWRSATRRSRHAATVTT